MTHPQIPGFRKVPHTGVLYVIKRAEELGYTQTHPEWANLGQGSPETGSLCQLPRITSITISQEANEYSPINGLRVVREKIAEHYNQLYRQHKKTQYTWENVAITSGGRAALTRIAASLGSINMGHFLPDYTAYEELLGIFKAFIPIPISLNHKLSAKELLAHLEEEIKGRGLRALLLSNPCNPTGKVIKDELLEHWLKLGKKYDCSLIFDEYYSHYIYSNELKNSPTLISAAQFVEKVDQDPVILINGLTKNWRYPGWRLGWIVGPKEMIESVGSTGSFLDGGPNHPLQTQILPLIEPQATLKEAQALQQVFREKRDYMLDRLERMGIIVENKPEGAFYMWANLSKLPSAINSGMHFFEAGLKEKVITVPGVFFDVNPEKRRTYARYNNYCRISFGPELTKLKQGLDALERIIQGC